MRPEIRLTPPRRARRRIAWEHELQYEDETFWKGLVEFFAVMGAKRSSMCPRGKGSGRGWTHLKITDNSGSFSVILLDPTYSFAGNERLLQWMTI